MSRIGKFQEVLGRRPGKGGAFGIEPHRPSYLANPGRPGLDQYWYPGRAGVEPGPAHFVRQLAAVSAKLAVVRPPPRAPLLMKRRAWLLWCQEPLVTHPLCPGWQLLFAWTSPTNEPLPLDDRVLANLYERDPTRYANALQYFDRITREQERADAKASDAFDAKTLDMSLDVRQYRKIKNIGMGNKFALHHDGSMVPSQGERIWRAQTLAQRLPESVRAEREDREDRLTKGQVSVDMHAAARKGAHHQWERDAQQQLAQRKLLDELRAFTRELATSALRSSRVGYTKSQTP